MRFRYYRWRFIKRYGIAQFRYFCFVWIKYYLNDETLFLLETFSIILWHVRQKKIGINFLARARREILLRRCKQKYVIHSTKFFKIIQYVRQLFRSIPKTPSWRIRMTYIVYKYYYIYNDVTRCIRANIITLYYIKLRYIIFSHTLYRVQLHVV